MSCVLFSCWQQPRQSSVKLLSFVRTEMYLIRCDDLIGAVRNSQMARRVDSSR